MRKWGIVLVLLLTACSEPPRYDGPEPTTPAPEPPAQGALYGRVIHESGTGAPRAAVGLRQWTDGEVFALLFTSGLSCVITCPQADYVKQTPEGAYSFPTEKVQGKELSIVAQYPGGAEAEVFFEKSASPQRVPDLVLWEPRPQVKKIGNYALVSWPNRKGSTFTVYADKNGQVSRPTRGTARLVPDWRLGSDVYVRAASKDGDVKYLHRTIAVPAPVTRRPQTGGDCLEVTNRRRAVLPYGDSIQISRDGKTFTTTKVPDPEWGVRNTVLSEDVRYVCGREVALW
ncbi:hypothetical protein Lesp02_20930 [Lentzea sp. NBRC 105346]|uniref:hypothetical protein n=1 Tax=Lentzea sp. NBRC 105346 TaxID=3032205 RepID=UPI0024A2E15C|nr:hypothetical protein [Lentzea sp. NBRC 105346]GLZ29903.1 hypothetical protein Lesp02_20930 [Lentzea sp. NBRC 105346]